MTNNGAYAIETTGLTKRFGKHLAVHDLSLKAPAGSVFAFLGRNGAGKTTTIRILLDLLNRTSGQARILGLDCVKDSLEIRKRIGYVAEAQKMYDWMKVDELIWFCKGFHPGWDDGFAEELKRRLELSGGKKLGDMSRGTQAKVALLLAMAYRPELLILDEPTAGLDVVVRCDFLEGVIELIQQEGRTVFFSSHLVHEVERVADWVGVIDEGKLVWRSTLDDLKASVKRMVLTFDVPPPAMLVTGRSYPFAGWRDQPLFATNVLKIETSGRQAMVMVKNFSEPLLQAAKTANPLDIQVEDMNLEDIFVALVGGPEV